MRKIGRIHIYSTLLLALFLHIVFLHRIRIFGCRPDLVLVVVVFFGLFSGARKGLEAGLLAGLLEDIFAADTFGINTFIFGITGLLAGALSTKFFKESKRTQTLLVFSFAVFTMTLHFWIAGFMSGYLAMSLRAYFISTVIPSGIYTAFVSIPIFSIFIRWYGLNDDKYL